MQAEGGIDETVIVTGIHISSFLAKFSSLCRLAGAVLLALGR